MTDQELRRELEAWAKAIVALAKLAQKKGDSNV